MDQLTQALHRTLQRSLLGAGAYWALNLLMIIAEARWHVLYHLTVLDFRALYVLAH
jgi:hypothetical protein